MVEWIEVKGPTVDLAVQVAMSELGVTERERVDVEVLEEPDRGFLGIGRRDAVVRVKKKPAKSRRRSRGRGRGREGEADGREPAEGRGREKQGTGARSQESSRQGGKQNAGGASRAQRTDRGRPQGGQRADDRAQGRSDGRGARKGASQAGGGERRPRSKGSEVSDRQTEEVDTGQQAEVVKEFLEGLLDAFGLEGAVEVRVEDEVIFAEMNGEQTEALIGDKAVIMYAIHELVRTVVQRKTMAGARIRLDISGYAERRRQALVVYAGRLADQVLEDGDEIMLEAMNPADRKVVHDAIAEIEGVRSFSEGEDPRRSVVIAPD